MTARPIDPESRRSSAYAAVALVLVMVAVLAAGCLDNDGKEAQQPENETVPVSHAGTTATMVEKPDIAAVHNSGTVNPVSRNRSCPDISYEPVFLLGDKNTTLFLGHEIKSENTGMAFCTEFNSSYTIRPNLIPGVIMKFDFVEFDQQQIRSMIGDNKEIDVWIRGEKHKVSLNGMNFTAEDTGIYSYSGLLEGISRNKVILTTSKNATLGSVIHEGDTFYITPVGSREDAAGNISIVYIVYNQQDVEPHSFSLAGDVITQPTTGVPVRYYEST
jgi:hypothetical protein